MLLAACGPGAPGQETGTGDTDTTATDSDAEPTGPTDPTVPTITDGTDGTDGTATGSSELCGSCSTLLAGDLSPANNPQIDGIILAVDHLHTTAAALRTNFGEHMRALAVVYGLPAADPTPNFVTQLTAAIKADFAASTANIRIVLVPGPCRSDIDTAVDALRRCEVGSGCAVAATPTRPPVTCEGACFGACDGACNGDLSCAVAIVATPCSGICDGTCITEAPTPCDGTCRGECLGDCSQSDSKGQCNGRCDGECSGSCDAKAPAQCSGMCAGTCLLEQGSAECSADATCRGSCDAACTGECAGKVTPKATPDCTASTDCQPQAAAQASARTWCAPPVLQIEFTFSDNLDPDARGAFTARAAALESHAAAALQDAAQLQALITGMNQGEPLFDPSPLLVVTTAAQQILERADQLNVPSARRPCVAPALQAAIAALADTAAASNDALQAQSIFTAFITNN